jgi:hypothetical protein
MANGKKQICSAILALALCHLLLTASFSSAAPTQEEVFKSLSNNLGPTVDGKKVFAVFLAFVGGAILLAAMSKRQKKAAAPQKLNHQGKLMRELVKTAGLTRSEVKTLQALTQQLQTAGQPLRSPLTLMLCPSLTRQPRDPAAADD